MGGIAFDTLKYSQRLMAMGMSEKQAVAQAEALAEAIGDLADNLVTRDHLSAQLAQMRGGELAEIRSTQRLHSWMLGVLVVTQLVPLVSG